MLLQSPPARTIALVALAALLTLAGCGRLGDTRLRDPSLTLAPYPTPRDVVIAVAPLRNESGVGVVSELDLTDELVTALAQVQGVAALPTNRTLAAMRSLEMASVDSPDHARQLAKRLGADGLIVGTITAWHPYEPPQLGLALALHAFTPAMLAGGPEPVLDPQALQSAATDANLLVASPDVLPVAVVSQVVDGGNHAVLADIRAYAEGRHDPHTAMGWRVFTKSMGMYTQYVSARLVDALMDSEARRVAAIVTTAQAND